MFNTARTKHADGQDNNYDFSGGSNAYDGSGGQHFDVAKAMFNQADTNRDGGIDRNEFQQWAQGGQQNFGRQSHFASANHEVGNNNFYHASLLDGANPAVANILQQSGIGQLIPH